ncbi:MAG: L-seryl-tRNA(Sec) selenium transferase [Planctomycetes bacterium]|nr:L-seryl-tRNA(Sec) selenium transferase [Planctomycetota bacterium]
MTPNKHEQLRQLPSMTGLLEDATVKAWLDIHPRAVVVAALNWAIDHARDGVINDDAVPNAESILQAALVHLESTSLPSIRRVINATGVVLHTGLGRAPLSQAAIDAVTQCASGYCNLEFDLESGARGRRADHVANLLAELTGAEAATVVNNNAAATFLILNTVASGVVVSRGELVEIGGSYRLPDMMQASGVELREVGTTNRTRIADYEKAIGPNVAALMRVHTSNYRIVGFTQAVDFDELVRLGRDHELPIIDDLGSGAMFDLDRFGLGGEPSVQASVEAGADLICFSGDKILGGPQAGIIIGRREWINRIERNPLMRTYRVGKMTLAALEATLQQYRDEDHARENIPSLSMMSTPLDELKKRAEELCGLLTKRIADAAFAVIEEQSTVGGGSLPDRNIATHCVTWSPTNHSVDEALARLRQGKPAIVARAHRGMILFDLRTIDEKDIQPLMERIAQLAANQ